MRPCRRRLPDRLPGAPGRRGRPGPSPGSGCPAGRWTGERTWDRAGHAGPRPQWPPSCSGWMGSGCCSPSSSGAPEFNQFVIELAPVGGFRPNPVPGDRGQHILASVDPVVQDRCVLCAVLVHADRPPGRCVAGRWWASASRYPWSLLWRAGDSCAHVRALVEDASSPGGSAGSNPAPARD